ncbi:hypothetical protein ACQP00_33045 [Dactylosporangium sp. CS-047395]|uniref:hypothetical protein n=1 Tax=Dactylosporangium sp. CS-047395 TaxID=3239936 RepID=UPI003D9118B8
MALTTPEPPLDVAATFPELATASRRATRLHPRRGEVGPHDSSLGGPLLWPSDDPWPLCDSPDHTDWDLIVGVPENATVRAIPLVPVLQLYARDVPHLPFPDGTDLCQVLWCPAYHQPAMDPIAVVRWRNSSSVSPDAATPPPPASKSTNGADSGSGAFQPTAATGAGLLTDPPQPGVDLGTGEFRPEPCRLHPEVVDEYPDGFALDDELRERVETWARANGWSYFAHLSTAPGTKAGGWPDWIQNPDPPDCTACGRSMDHLLTIASVECDGESWRRWVPMEELSARQLQPDGQPPAEAFAAEADAGLMIGDAGDYYIFVCTHCPHRPTATLSQCS